jgi:hypothetical protein
LPQESGYSWAWLAKKEDGTWQEGTKIENVNRQAHFGGRQEIREGWLRLKLSTPTDETPANR